MAVRYTGNDYGEFIRLVLADRGLLQRDLAALMGLSPAWASQMLNGRRKLQMPIAERIADVMHFDDAERWELTRLVEQGKAPAVRERKPAGDPRVHSPTLDRWYVGAIRELARCDQYQPDPVWVAAALRPRIDEHEAREAMDLLRRHGLLDLHYCSPDRPRVGRNGIRPSDRDARTVAQLTLEALRTAPPNERRHLTGSIALSEEAYERILPRMRSLFKELLATPDPDVPNRVYHLSVTAFPISLYSDAAAHPAEIED